MLSTRLLITVLIIEKMVTPYELRIPVLDDIFTQLLRQITHKEILSTKYVNSVSAKRYSEILDVEKKWLKIEADLVANVSTAKRERIAAEKAMIACQINEITCMCNAIEQLHTIPSLRQEEVESVKERVEGCVNAEVHPDSSENSVNVDVAPSPILVCAMSSCRPIKPQYPFEDEGQEVTNKRVLTKPVLPDFIMDEIASPKVGRKKLLESNANGSWTGASGEDESQIMYGDEERRKLDYLDEEDFTSNIFNNHLPRSSAILPRKPVLPDFIAEPTVYISNTVQRPKLPSFIEETQGASGVNAIKSSNSSAFRPLQAQNDGFAVPDLPAPKMKAAMKNLRRSMDTTTFNETYIVSRPKLETVSKSEYTKLETCTREKLSIHQLNCAVVALERLFINSAPQGVKRQDIQRTLHNDAMLDPIEALLAVSVLTDMGKLHREKTKQDVSIFAIQ